MPAVGALLNAVPGGSAITRAATGVALPSFLPGGSALTNLLLGPSSSGNSANPAVAPGAQDFFNTQSAEDQAAIRASWNPKDNQNKQMNAWYNNANQAGAVPPPPVPAPAGPAQSAPGLTAAPQPAPQPGPPNNVQSGYTGTRAPNPNMPAPTVGGAPAPASATGSVAGMLSNSFTPAPKKPFDYEAAKAQYGVQRAREMQNEG